MIRGIRKSVLWGLGLALAALAASALLTFRNIEAIARKEALIVHTHQVLDGLNLTLSIVKDAETGMRGFLLTGEERYLEPYDRASAGIEEQLSIVNALVIDSPSQAKRLQSLQAKVEARLAFLAQGIAARRGDGAAAGQEHVRQGLGKRAMDEIRVDVAEMIAVEQALLERRAADAQTIYGTAYATMFVTTAVGVLLVSGVLALALRETAEQATQAEELEQRVRQRTVELNEANDALNVSNRELEQFASVASHDLQEPLRKIEAFGDRLKTRSAEQLDERGHDYLARMLQSALRMRTLINDLLTFSRVTSKTQPMQPISLKEIAEAVAGDLEGRLQQEGGQILIGELPAIQGDPLQMRQLLQNLIGNGLKFHRPGVAPVVRVAARMLQNGANNPVCELTIADNGIGFEEIYLDRIFDVFQRLHGRSEYEGTGMGLAICRKIVERHGGEITATSKPNEGARFFVTLPAKQRDKESHA